MMDDGEGERAQRQTMGKPQQARDTVRFLSAGAAARRFEAKRAAATAREGGSGAERRDLLNNRRLLEV